MTRSGTPTPSLSVALLVRSLNYGGAERQLVELAKGLHRRGHSVTVVSFYEGGPLLAELEAAGVGVVQLAKRGRWDVVFAWRLIQFLRRKRPDVLYAFLVDPSLLSALIKPLLDGTRIVWGVRASRVDYGTYGWFPWATFQASRVFSRSADLIIVNSWAGADYHRAAGYPAGRITVVANGIDLERFQPDAVAGQRARAALGVPAHTRVIGSVGRLDPMKDYATFLEAAALVSREEPDVVYVCVGDGPPAHRIVLQARAERLGLGSKVIWAGSQQDMRAAYNALDVCCLASAFGEGFPNVLGEALACGVPCVSTDVGDAARILQDAEFIAPPGNPSRLAEALKRALVVSAIPERRRACRAMIAERFGVEQMVSATERALRASLHGT